MHISVSTSSTEFLSTLLCKRMYLIGPILSLKGQMIDVLLRLSFVTILCYADKRIVSRHIMKLYIERNNLQLKLIR